MSGDRPGGDARMMDVGGIDLVLAKAERAEAFDLRVVPVAAALGLAAALAGGAAWAAIVHTSRYEIGFVAWGIGFAAAAAVTLGARGRRGLPLQLVAAATAALGFLFGKYLVFALDSPRTRVGKDPTSRRSRRRCSASSASGRVSPSAAGT